MTYDEDEALGAYIRRATALADSPDLVTSHLALVVYFAKKYAASSGVPILDLIQEGNIALIEAAKRFKPEKVDKFSTYASYAIRQRMTKAVGKQSAKSAIPIPVGAMQRINRINRAKQELQAQLERAPTLEEIAQETNYPLHRVKDLEAHQTRTYLSACRDDDDTPPIEIPDHRPEAELDQLIDPALLAMLANALTPMQYETVVRIHGLDGGAPMTLHELAQETGNTVHATRARLMHAYKRLRDEPAIREFLT